MHGERRRQTGPPRIHGGASCGERRIDDIRAKATRTAILSIVEGQGVCRDFARLAIALCRCMHIPARYCTGYPSDIWEPLRHPAGDFSAWIEVFHCGEWHLFELRNKEPRYAGILIVRGRDSADVQLTRTFGRNTSTEFKVWTHELA